MENFLFLNNNGRYIDLRELDYFFVCKNMIKEYLLNPHDEIIKYNSKSDYTYLVYCSIYRALSPKIYYSLI